MKQRVWFRPALGILSLVLLLTFTSKIVRSEDKPGEILFVSEQDGHPEIYAVNSDGSNLKRLTYTAQGSTFPRWSPDGKHIAFLSGNHVYVMDADGTDQKRLTSNGIYYTIPQWWPDSQHISLFSAHTFQKLNIDGSAPQNLFDVDSAPYPPQLTAVLSPNGDYIAVKGYIGAGVAHSPLDITFVKTDGSQSQSFMIVNFLYFDEGAWSPDSEHILYMTFQGKGTPVLMMNRDGISPTFNDNGPYFQDLPLGQEYKVWSPNGKYIVAECCFFLGPIGPSRKITIVMVGDLDNAKRAKAELLTTVEILPDDPNKRGFFDPPVSMSGFSWAPDSQRLVFAFNAGQYELALMNVDGSGRKSILVRDTPLYDPHWSPISYP